MSGHTALPWSIDHQLNVVAGRGHPAHDRVRTVGFSTATGDLTDDAIANAAFIVRAVNSHDELVAALHELVNAADAHGESLFYGGDLDGEDEDVAATTERINAALDVARAALAKVTS